MKHTGRRRHVVRSLFLVILIILLHVMQRIYSLPPLLLWNRTQSVPLGIYRRIRVTNIRAGQIIYASIQPDVLFNVAVDMSGVDREKLLYLYHTLQTHTIPLLKQVSPKDVNSIAAKIHRQRKKEGCISCILLQETLYVVSPHKNGIDSKILGEINFNNISGFYVLSIQFN